MLKIMGKKILTILHRNLLIHYNVAFPPMFSVFVCLFVCLFVCCCVVFYSQGKHFNKTDFLKTRLIRMILDYLTPTHTNVII